MAQPDPIAPYRGRYMNRAVWLRRVLRDGYMISAKGKRYDLNVDGLLMVAYAVRAFESERGPVTPLRDVLAKVVR